MRTRSLLAAVASVAVLAACTSGADAGPVAGPVAELEPGALPHETLLLGTEGGPVAVRTPAGTLLSSFPGAISAADGSLVYTTTTSHGSTVLRALSATTGSTASQTRLRGDLEVRIVSGSGRAAALLDPLPRGWDPWTPIPRSRTTIVVADPTGSAEPRRYALEGNFEPEAFSTDDADLFLIQHLPAMQPTVYRVTRLDLATGRVRPVPGPFKVPPERMPGTRLQQLASPLGTQLYTLYSSARPGYAPHGAPVSSDAVVSFVHVLDLEYGWAHCVGLPEAMWNRPTSAQALATTPDGRLLYVVDPGLGLVAAMNTRTLRVSTGTFPAVAGSTGRSSVETSADGSALFVAAASNGSTALTLVDASTFEVRDRRELAGEVTDLARSPDGAFVFAATSGHVVVLDGRTGRPLGTVELDAPGDVTSVTALAA